MRVVLSKSLIIRSAVCCVDLLFCCCTILARNYLRQFLGLFDVTLTANPLAMQILVTAQFTSHLGFFGNPIQHDILNKTL
jgi:hypothetical protein